MAKVIPPRIPVSPETPKLSRSVGSFDPTEGVCVDALDEAAAGGENATHGDG